MPRIALIHAVSVAIEPVILAFESEWPEADVTSLLDDSLAADLNRAGRLNQKIIHRFGVLARYVKDCGSDGILFTCSAFGPAIERVAEDLAPMPVLKPNEAMFEAAIDQGSTIGLLATFGPSIPSMEKEFNALCEASGKSVQLKTACVPEAMTALRNGDAETHNALVAETAKELEECDVLMLAQFSTAQAKEAVNEQVSISVLTSPASAVLKLKRLLGGL